MERNCWTILSLCAVAVLSVSVRTHAQDTDPVETIYSNDFEQKDDVGGTPNTNGTCRSNFKGLSEEKARSGKKSLKLDFTVSGGHFCYWYCNKNFRPEPGLSFSGQVYSTGGANVSLGIRVIFPRAVKGSKAPLRTACWPLPAPFGIIPGSWSTVMADNVYERIMGVAKGSGWNPEGAYFTWYVTVSGGRRGAWDGNNVRIVVYVDDVIIRQQVKATENPKTGEDRGCRIVAKDLDGDGKVEVVLENEFVKLVFSPHHGGRCSNLVLKGSEDLVWWGPPGDIIGGVLEDHFWQQNYPGDFTDRAYQYRIVSDSRDKASLQLSSRGSSGFFKDVEVVKTVSIHRGRSYIDADYELKNVMPTATARPLRFGFWAHHILRAGGPLKAVRNTYFAPTTKGIRQINFDPATAKGQIWEYHPSRGWSGVVGENGDGIVCLFDYKYLKCLYWCPANKLAPSLEWRYNKVEVKPGEGFKTRIRFLPFKGLPSIEGAGTSLVGSLTTSADTYEKNEPISATLTLLSGEDQAVNLSLAYRILPSETFAKVRSKRVVLEANALQKLPFRFDPGKEGTCVIYCRATAGDKLAGEFFKPVIVGKSSGPFAIAPAETRVTIKETLASIVPQEWRPIAKPLDTPHIKWAQPYAGGKPKVLIIAGEFFQRDVTELAQRMDMDYDFIPLEGLANTYFCDLHWNVNKDRVKFIEEKLLGDYDAIFTANFRYGEFPEKIRKTIADKVAQGTGLLCIVPDNAPGFSEILPVAKVNEHKTFPGEWKKEREHPVSTGIPFALLPKSAHYRYAQRPGTVLASAGGDPLVSVGEHGKGRIVAICYRPHLASMTPTVNHHEVGFDYWEYYFSLFAKGLYWVAQGAPPVRIVSLAPEGEAFRRGEPPKISLSLVSDRDRKVLVRARLKDKEAAFEAEIEAEAALSKDGTTRVELHAPRRLPVGLHLADVHILDRNQRVLNWGTAYFHVAADFRLGKITTDKEYYRGPAKKQIRANVEVENDGGRERKAALLATLADSYGRLVIRQSKQSAFAPGRSLVELDLAHPHLIAPAHTLTVVLRDDSGALDKRSSPVFTPWHRDKGFEDYWVMAWYPHQPSYLSPHFYRLARSIGMNSMCGSGADLRMMTESNLWYHQENLPWVGTHKQIEAPGGGFIRDRCYSRTPTFGTEHVTNAIKRARKYNLLFYSIGEENALNKAWDTKMDLCFCDACKKRFRQWLTQQYGDLQRLNDQWGTRYNAWEQVVPIPWDKADKQNPSQWVDFRVFQDQVVWGHGIRDQCDLIRKIDPGAYVGINCSGDVKSTESPFSGWDYTQLSKYEDAGILYKEEAFKLELLRSFGDFRASVANGYGRTDSTVKWTTWYWTLHGARGMSFFKFASSAPGFGYQWFIHPNLALCGRSRLIQEACGDLLNGLGKILIETPRYKEDEIAILYWRPSMFRSWIEDPVPDGPSHTAYFASNQRFRSAIERLQLQYRFIIEEQVMKGALDRYKALLLPYLVAPTPDLLDRIEAFVKRGGVVIANMRLARTDRHGKPADYSGFLKRVFGLARKSDECSFDLGMIHPLTPHHSMNLSKAVRVIGREQIAPDTADTVARHEDGTPAITIHKCGSGWAVYLNFVPLTNVGKVTEQALALAGVKREVKLTSPAKSGGAGDEVELTYETFRYKKGSVEYVAVLRPSGGSDRKKEVRIQLPRTAHIYDVRTKEYLGHRQQVTRRFDSPDYKVLALLPYRVDGIGLELSANPQRGKVLRYNVSMSPRPAGDHILRVVVFDPDGNPSEAYTKNVTAPNGAYAGEIPLALNEKAGTWRVKCVGVVSGKTAEKSFQLSASR